MESSTIILGVLALFALTLALGKKSAEDKESKANN